MSAYRFFPLKDEPHTGILQTPKRVQVAEFLTVVEARWRAHEKGKAA